MESEVIEAPAQQPVAQFIKPIVFATTDQNIQRFRADYMGLTINGIEDNEGAKIVHAARIIIRNSRLDVVKLSKDLMADAIEYQKQVKAEASRIVGLLEPIEDYLDQLESNHKEEKKRAKEAEEAAERTRLENRVERLKAAGMTWDGESQVYSRIGLTLWITWEDVRKLADDEFEDQVLIVEEFHNEQLAIEAEAQRKAEEQRQAQEEADRKERERVAAEQKAERERLDAARREQEAERKRLDDEAAQLRQEMAELRAEKQRIENERVAAENTEKERQAEIDRQAQAEQAERNRQMQEAQQARNLKRQTAIDARLQKERKQRLAADKESLRDFVSILFEVEHPQLENEEAKELLLEFQRSFTPALNHLHEQIDAL